MSKIKLHVSHDFVKLTANDAYTFGRNIILQLTSNSTAFPNLPITIAALTASNTLLNNTYVDYLQ